MHFKLIIVMVEDGKTEKVLDAARQAGATGATVLNQARGEGIRPTRTFLGLSVGNPMLALIGIFVFNRLCTANRPSPTMTTGLIAATWRTRNVSQTATSSGSGSRLFGGLHLRTLQI